jgi:hypothetical protein
MAHQSLQPVDHLQGLCSKADPEDLMVSDNSETYAHVSGEHKQLLSNHLCKVAELSSSNARKVGLPLQGELIGLLHDLGKYSAEFQNYLKSATGLLNFDEDEDFVDAKGLKGKIETTIMRQICSNPPLSRPPRARGLKPSEPHFLFDSYCRAPRGRVD